MHEGILPALRQGPLSFSNGMLPLNDGVIHDMITSGSMAAASSPGLFTQEEARVTEAVAARGAIDDQNDGFGDGTHIDEEEEDQADLNEEDDTPESTPMSKGRKKRKKNSSPTKPRVKWTAKKRSASPKLGRPFP
jgi:hypothetical protein